MDHLLRVLLALLVVALCYASYRFGYRRGARHTSLVDIEAYSRLYYTYVSLCGYSDALLARHHEALQRLGEK